MRPICKIDLRFEDTCWTYVYFTDNEFGECDNEPININNNNYYSDKQRISIYVPYYETLYLWIYDKYDEIRMVILNLVEYKSDYDFLIIEGRLVI